MGQYLAIGLVIECCTSKKHLQEFNISKNDLIEEMKNKLHFHPEIYDFSETEANYVFKLQSNVWESQLISFLQKFYPVVYCEDNNSYENTIKKLQSSEPSTWLEFADRKSAEEFQLDSYGEVETLYFKRPFRPTVRITSNMILLSCQGKVIMEEYHRQFNLFAYCLHETFSTFQIAKAVKVYITG